MSPVELGAVTYVGVLVVGVLALWLTGRGHG